MKRVYVTYKSVTGTKFESHCDVDHGEVLDTGALVLRDDKRTCIAIYAPGEWVRVER